MIEKNTNLLGLWPDAANRKLQVRRPRLPAWLGTLEIQGMQVGGAASICASSASVTTGGST